LIKSHEIFLEECKYLEEARIYIKKGFSMPKTIHGKRLEDFLVINRKDLEVDSTATTTTTTTSYESKCCQTEVAEVETDEVVIIDNVEPDENEPKRQRKILIGKNVEKKQDISY
jgi:hypothetical protein